MTYQTINPTTGKLEKSFPEATDAECLAALTTADTCYSSDWKQRTIADRAQIVGRAAQILRAKGKEYSDLMTTEMGKVVNIGSLEVELSANILDYYAKHAEAFLAPKALPEAPGAVVTTEPTGVIVGIEPWNFPYYQLARVAGPQLVAGNVLIMKHAPSVPQCALAFARLFEEAGAPPGAYTNLFASNEQIGTIIDDFRVRGVTLTGSERAGSSVAERAGRKLKKVVLELGGSDPLIILEDAPLPYSMDQAVIGRVFNTGESCTGSKRIIVVGKDRGKLILDGLVERFRALKVGDPSDPSTSVGPLFAERALQGLLDQIKAASAAGARVVLGGNRVNRPGFFLEPTIITEISESNPLYRQEAFGPVLSYYVVDSEEQAIRVANDTPYGLGSAVFSADVERAKRIAARIEAGMVFINSFATTSPELPFGGVKNSGFGRELSELGIGEFVNRKLVRVAAAA